MPSVNSKQKLSPKLGRKQSGRDNIRKPKTKPQKAGGADICSKDINQLLMGNPPASIGGVDPSEVWKDTKKSGKDLDNYSKKGWGNYPGTPPKPDCAIL